MLTLDEAYRRLLARAHPTESESILLADALSRVLADPKVTAARDVPGFDNSAMDGYAVRAADTPGQVRLAGEIAAGAAEVVPLEAGTAVRIMTGAPLPPGADAVVPVEVATEGDDNVEVGVATPGDHVRLTAHDTRAGDEICLPDALTPPMIAVLASIGVGQVRVRRRPRIAILSTGDELVDVGKALGRYQIHDANGIALAAAVREAGGEPVLLPRARDDAREIEQALVRAAHDADLLVTSAGVSVGRHDHVRTVLERRGSLDFWRIAVQPGKPLAVGALGGKTVIGLPGNPVSALVVFELFVRPFVRAMSGLTGDGRLHVRATPTTRIGKDAQRRAFLRVTVWHEDGEMHARPAGGQASSQLRPLAEGNALLVVPEGTDAAEPGRSYEAIVFGPLKLAYWR
jgi:molybdopterin molybdotransferase